MRPVVTHIAGRGLNPVPASGDAYARTSIAEDTKRMAHNSAGLPPELEEGQFTRRQIIQGLALTAAATTFAGATEAAQAPAGDASAKVRATLETLVRDTPEIGLQVAAYLDGKLVVDAWAGMADEATKKPVDGDTLFMLSSTTKGVTATCMHAFVEKHKLDYDMPIVKVWPEFGANGKRGRDAASRPVPPDRRAPDTGRLHARLAARLGQDVPRHRRPEADVSRLASGPPTTR